MHIHIISLRIVRCLLQCFVCMIKVHFILFALVFCSCVKNHIQPSSNCSSYEGDSSAIHPKADKFQSLIDTYVAKGLPGISFAVTDQYGLWMGGAGKADIDENIDLQPCIVSKSCSITKTILAVVIMKLVEQGLIDLDAPASVYLDDDIVSKIENLDQCTLRNLMNHSSGIYNLSADTKFYLKVLNNPTHYWTYNDLLKYVYGKKAFFEPGTDVKYSNTNYLLVAMIVDRASGRPHNELMHEFVLDPLHMNDTYYHYHDQLPSNTAQGYYDLYNNGTILNITNYNTGSGNGYGGVYSTSYDLQKLCKALLVDRTLVSEKSLSEMMSFGEEEEGKNRRFGLGLFKDFLERDSAEYGIGHRGRDFQYTADMFYFPSAGAVMTYHVNYGTDGETALGEVFYEFRSEAVDLLFDK